MHLTGWALYAALTMAVFVGVIFHYRRHEPAGPGRYVLAGLRGASLALVLLLVFDPSVPSWRPGAEAPTIALVDASLSMRLPGPDGTTRWAEARRAVDALDPARVIVFGASPPRVVASLDDVRPDQPATLLAPALGPALEADRGRVVVITDGAIDDMADVARAVRESGARVAVRQVGHRTAGNLGLVELTAPAWSPAGEAVEVVVGVGRIGEDLPDSVTVGVRWGDRVLSELRLPVPAEGRVSTGSVRFTPPAGMEGLVRLDASIDASDAEPADDARSVYVRVEEQPPGVVLLSFVPDQEPRFLLPVVERAAGIPARGWLALGADHFVRLGVGATAGVRDDEATVRGALEQADLLVVHGFDQDVPAWARSAVGAAGRVLVFPRGPAPELPLALGPPAAGDWYPVSEIPASPIAPFLTAADVARAPPVTRVHTVEPPAGWWTPLHVRQDRRGAAYPTLLGRDAGERRTAVALADGYWRWAFAEEGGRDLYDAYWAGVVAWLLDAPHDRRVDALRPQYLVVPRGRALRWVAPRAADSVRVTLHPLAGPDDRATAEGARGSGSESPLDTVLAAAGGIAEQQQPAPGHYRYEARAFLEGDQVVEGVGELTIERYSPEFTSLARAVDLEGDGPPTAARAGPVGRPLRTLAWPYLALVILLCVEWVLRRRWGLR